MVYYKNICTQGISKTINLRFYGGTHLDFSYNPEKSLLDVIPNPLMKDWELKVEEEAWAK